MSEHVCKNEARIRQLETNEAVMGVKIDNLINELNKLTNTLKSLLYLGIPIALTVIGYLFKEWVKG